MITAAVRLALAAVALTLTTLVAAPSAVHAHASQVGSAPSADEVLPAAPAEVRIDFDSGLLEMGAALVVRDENEESVTTGPAVVGDRTFTVPVDPRAAPGVYSVAYRVVSADGHTIEGSFDYTVAGDVAQSAVTTAPSAAPVAGQESDASWLPIALFAGVGIVVIIGLGGALLLRR